MLLLLSLFACKEAIPETKDVSTETSTEPSSEDTGGITECEESLETTPNINLGSSSWFYRDPIRLTFGEQNVSLNLSATDSTGADVPVSFEWNASSELAEVLPASGTWAGDESYTLHIEYCQHSADLGFSTSEYGLPLDISDEDLIGNTYNIDLATATYTDPPGIGTLLGQNIDQPLLLGIESVHDSQLDFIASLGLIDNFGEISQDGDFWYFPNAVFTNAPYFDAYSEYLSIQYGQLSIPIHGFKISGTFSADGTTIGQAHFEGLGDTREIGPALSAQMNEYSICVLLEANGADCEFCPDDTTGEKFCAFLAGDIDNVALIPDFILESSK